MTKRAAPLALTRALLVGLCVCWPSCTSTVQAIRLAAEQGDADAQYNLGFAYAVGRSVPRDDAEAVRWFRLAADQGLAEAQFILGFMYAEGRGVPQDDAEAARWHLPAATQGHARAQFSLGLNYAEGRGVQQDRVAAYMWLSLAAAQASAADRNIDVAVRDAVAEQMTAEQIAEAQRLAGEWEPTLEP